MAADPNELSKKQERALRVAAKEGGPASLELIKTLLASKVNVDACGDGFKKTALHLACQYNHADIASLLLTAGANPLAEDKDHHTPLALARQAGHARIIAILDNHIPKKTVDKKETIGIRENLSQEFRLKTASHETVVRKFEKLRKLIDENFQTLSKQIKAYGEILEFSVISALQQQLFGKVRPLPLLTPEEMIRINQKLALYEMGAQFIGPAIRSLATALQNFKDPNFNIVPIITQNTIVLCLKLEIQFKDRKRIIEDELKGFLIAKNSTVSREVVKRIETLMFQMSEVFLEKTLKTILNENHRLMGSPQGYLEFLREYFPDADALDNLGDKLNRATENWAQGQARDGFDYCQNFILDKIEYYFEHCKSEIEGILRSRRAKIEAFFLLRNSHSDSSSQSSLSSHSSDSTFVSSQTSQAASNLLLSLDVQCRVFGEIVKEITGNSFSDLMRTIRCSFEAIVLNDSNTLITTPSLALVDCYLAGRMTVHLLETYLENIDNEFKSVIQQKCAALKREFLRDLNLQEPPADWVSVRAKEIEVQKAKNKEAEDKKREENQAQRETSQLRAFNLRQQQQAEEKLQGEMDEIRKKMLGSIKKDAESIEVLEGVLGGNTRLKQVAFFKLVKILKIPGYDAIPDTNSLPEGNKLTLHHKPHFKDPIVVHCKHGKDRSELIDPNAVKQLKQMMETFGINKDNLRKLILSSSLQT